MIYFTKTNSLDVIYNYNNYDLQSFMICYLQYYNQIFSCILFIALNVYDDDRMQVRLLLH